MSLDFYCSIQRKRQNVLNLIVRQNSPWLVSKVQPADGGITVWGIFSWHILDPLVLVEHRLNATPFLSIVADYIHPFYDFMTEFRGIYAEITQVWEQKGVQPSITKVYLIKWWGSV